MTEDGSYILAGHTEGNWNGERNGGRDFAAVKLDAGGKEVWKWQVRETYPQISPRTVEQLWYRISQSIAHSIKMTKLLQA